MEKFVQTAEQGWEKGGLKDRSSFTRFLSPVSVIDFSSLLDIVHVSLFERCL